MRNIFQRNIVPEKPSVLNGQSIFVYVPIASNGKAGVAEYDKDDFNIRNGLVSLMWPMKRQIEVLSNPLQQISRVKLLSDEFENTGVSAELRDGSIDKGYVSDKAEVRLVRTNRNAFSRPELVMLSSNDFDVSVDENQYAKYTLKIKNPTESHSIVKLNSGDFKYSIDNITSIIWPFANDPTSTTHTSGYGLMKIRPESDDYLKYSSGYLSLDSDKLFLDTRPEVEYGGTESSGFTDRSDYVDSNGLAILDGSRIKLKIDKHSVGLSKVLNKSFNEYVYTDFGLSMKNTFDSRFNSKLNKSEWNSLFSDWSPISSETNTVQKWFIRLEEEDTSIKDSVRTLQRFLGYFEDESSLVSRFPATEDLLGSFAYVNSFGKYFAVFESEGVYSWNDTGKSELDFNTFVENDSSIYRENGTPSAGSSGKWAQSDHVHPSDSTKLDKSLYVNTVATFTSESPNENDFVLNFWKELDGQYIPNRTVNIPNVRLAKGLHNWKGSNSEFVDSDLSTEFYWSGSFDEYQAEVDEIRPNSLIVVNDDPTFFVDPLVSTKEMYNQGITIDSTNSNDRFVIVDNRTSNTLVGNLLTLREYSMADSTKRYALGTLNGLDIPNSIVTTYRKSDGSAAIKGIELTNGRMIVGTDIGPIESLFDYRSLLKTDPANNVELESGKLLISDLGNIVKTIDLGTIKGIMLSSNGNGGVELQSFDNRDRLLMSGQSGEVIDSGIDYHSILRTQQNIRELDKNKLLLIGESGYIEPFDTGDIANRLIVSDGLGGIKKSELPAGKLMYSSSLGTISAFPTTELDSGKFFGVDSAGSLSLKSLPEFPKTSPISTYTNEPGTNPYGTILCILDSDPSVYSPGVLYLW